MLDQSGHSTKGTATVHPPEYWTEENTRAWRTEMWGNPEGWTPAMRQWGGKYTSDVPRARIPAPTAKQYKAWSKQRAADPTPTPVHFYDGQVDPKRAALGGREAVNG